jgi:hypothetical protein
MLFDYKHEYEKVQASISSQNRTKLALDKIHNNCHHQNPVTHGGVPGFNLHVLSLKRKTGCGNASLPAAQQWNYQIHTADAHKKSTWSTNTQPAWSMKRRICLEPIYQHSILTLPKGPTHA